MILKSVEVQTMEPDGVGPVKVAFNLVTPEGEGESANLVVMPGEHASSVAAKMVDISKQISNRVSAMVYRVSDFKVSVAGVGVCPSSSPENIHIIPGGDL